MTHSSPSSAAFVLRLARSEPASGSLNPWHHEISPERMRGMNCFFCSSVPHCRMRRSHQGVAEEVPAQRRPDPGELLVQHHLLEQRQTLAAVLDGPAGADPTAGEELGRPLVVERGPLLGGHGEFRRAPAVGQILLEPCADDAAELFCLWGVRQVHDTARYPPWRSVRKTAGSPTDGTTRGGTGAVQCVARSERCAAPRRRTSGRRCGHAKGRTSQ